MTPPGIVWNTVEDAFNDALTLHIKFRKCLTFDKSCTAGWYHRCINIGPKPKPIQTRATMYSMGVIEGPMRHYMLKVHTYCGATDKDLCKKINNVGTVQKNINLLELFLWNFIGRLCSCTMDSAYMGQQLAMIACKE